MSHRHQNEAILTAVVIDVVRERVVENDHAILLERHVSTSGHVFRHHEPTSAISGHAQAHQRREQVVALIGVQRTTAVAPLARDTDEATKIVNASAL